MIKLLFIAISLVAVCLCQDNTNMPGSIFDNIGVSDEAREIANWTTSKIASYTDIAGVYTVQEITNVKTQVVAGINYYLTIVYSLSTQPNVRFHILYSQLQ